MVYSLPSISYTVFSIHLNAHFAVFYLKGVSRKLLRHNVTLDTGNSVWMLRLDHVWLTAQTTIFMISQFYNMTFMSFVPTQ